MDRTIEMCKIKNPGLWVEKRVMGADWSRSKRAEGVKGQMIWFPFVWFGRRLLLYSPG